MNEVEQAVAYFLEGYSCSQSIVLAFRERVGLDRETALRMAGPFGGGMARLGSTCGALTGSYMILGLKFYNHDDPQAKDKMYTIVRSFTDRFKERNSGRTGCSELLECDISTPEGAQIAHQKRTDPRYCPKFVRDAAELLVEML